MDTGQAAVGEGYRLRLLGGARADTGPPPMCQQGTMSATNARKECGGRASRESQSVRRTPPTTAGREGGAGAEERGV